MRRLAAIIFFAAVLLLATGCASPIGTWVVDLEKTITAIERIPAGVMSKYETLDHYKQDVAEKTQHLELTFTNAQFYIPSWIPVWVDRDDLKVAVLKNGQGKGITLCWWYYEEKYRIYRPVPERPPISKSIPWLWGYGCFVFTGDTAIWEPSSDFWFVPSIVYLKRKPSGGKTDK